VYLLPYSKPILSPRVCFIRVCDVCGPLTRTFSMAIYPLMLRDECVFTNYISFKNLIQIQMMQGGGEVP
jgi:hypothetical protein